MATDTVHTRFARAWESVANPPLDSVNPHFKNKFASLNATLKVIREACAKNGIVYVQCFDYVPGEEPTFVISTGVQDAEGGSIELSRMYFPVTDNPQQLGSAMTYCRRYAAQLDWGIVGEEDDDAERAMPQAEQRPQPKPRAKKPVRFGDTKLFRECVSLGVKPDGMEKWYAAQDFRDKTIDQLTKAEQKQVQTYLQDVRESILAVSE